MRSDTGAGDTWDRYTPLAGFVFVLAFIVSAVLYFSGGTIAHDNPSSVQSFVLAHRHTLETSWWVLLIGQLASLVYIISLVSMFHRRTGAWGAGTLLLLAAGAAGIAIDLAADGLVFTALFAADKVPAGVTYSLYEAGNAAVSDMGAVGVGLALLVSGCLILGTHVMRPWIGWVGIVGGVLFALPSNLGSGALGIIGLVGGILALVFVLATSISMLTGNVRAVPSRIPAAASS